MSSLSWNNYFWNSNFSSDEIWVPMLGGMHSKIFSSVVATTYVLLCGHSPWEQDMHCAFPSCTNSLFKSCVTKTSENRFPYRFNSLDICACRENRTLAGRKHCSVFQGYSYVTLPFLLHEGPKTDYMALYWYTTYLFSTLYYVQKRIL